MRILKESDVTKEMALKCEVSVSMQIVIYSPAHQLNQSDLKHQVYHGVPQYLDHLSLLELPCPDSIADAFN